jgi:colanic acid biosynthesis glycosyl transferase WcaI
VPAKLQSYLASGRPVLASLGGEGAEIVREAGAGLVVPPGDFQALAAAAIQLKQMDFQSREELGTRGLEYSSLYFEREVRLTEMEEIFKQIARGTT